VLLGFRAAAGLAAPGRPLEGWARSTAGGVFGQWLSGMARLYRATGEPSWRDRAALWMREWSKTVKSDGDCRMGHYAWEKVVWGLVDMHVYAGDESAIPLLERTTDWASRHFSRENLAAIKDHYTLYSGRPGEWYTLPENLYRAYQATGNAKFKDFA